MNSLGEMMIASRHGDFPVKKGDKLAGTRIIPLVIEKEKMDRAVESRWPGNRFFHSSLSILKRLESLQLEARIKKGLIRILLPLY